MIPGDHLIDIHKEPDGRFVAEVLDMPGTFVSATTLDELRNKIAEAVARGDAT